MLRVRGEVDLVTAPMLWEALAAAIKSAPTQVVVNLADTSFFDCSGVRVLVRCFGDLPYRGAQVILQSPNPLVRKVFELTGVDQQCTVET